MSHVLFHERQGSSPWFPAGRAAHARLRRKNLRAEMSHVMLVSSAWSGYFAPTPTRLFGIDIASPRNAHVAAILCPTKSVPTRSAPSMTANPFLQQTAVALR